MFLLEGYTEPRATFKGSCVWRYRLISMIVFFLRLFHVRLLRIEKLRTLAKLSPASICEIHVILANMLQRYTEKFNSSFLSVFVHFAIDAFTFSHYCILG